MTSQDADRNLLFGTLAMQMDFISREDLIAAASAWVRDKSRTIDQILLDRGSLSPEDHAVLEPLVRKHLEGPGGSRGGGRASSGSGGPRRDWNGMADSDLRASLHRTLGETREHPVGDDPFVTRAVDDGPSGWSEGMRFRILRPLAQGGLGRLTVALDQELGREVALKEIKERHADHAQSRARFVLEAEVTGGLEHPGVVPVYSLGHYPDGRPYYAMRLIRGDSLEEVIRRYHEGEDRHGHGRRRRSRLDEHSLGLRKMLRHFLDACDAVEYAHHRGVLHRDLKPENIMVGRFGETLVVDWGLAKPLGLVSRGGLTIAPGEGGTADEPPSEPPLAPSSSGGSAETVAGSALGTPAYMSPEQAEGRNDLLGARSDVYSLGATLYHLLTGRAPFGGQDVGLVLKQVRRGEFPPPRAVNRRVPRDLEAICLKAMATRASDRYESARALADDLEHWLADEPIEARPDSGFARVARWGRRHRAWVRAGASAVAVIGVVASLAAVQLGRMADHEGRMAAQLRRTRDDLLRVAAQFASRTVANEMSLRWQVLETQALDPDLRGRLAAASNTEAGRAPLQAWLERVAAREAAATGASNWFVTDRDGNQLARAPRGNSIGENFAYRDYFHGLGRDLARGERGEPIRRVHRSIIFRSTASNEYMVTFTAPIWDGEPGEPGASVVGVLGISVEVGRFGVLRLGLGGDQVAVLVDTRPDEQGRAGFLLHHPALAHIERDRPDFFLPSRRVAELVALRGAAMKRSASLDGSDREDRLESSQAPLPGGFDAEYEDPVGVGFKEYAGRWLAAFQPVLVPGRPDEIQDTGWVVIVQERAGE